MAYEAAGHDRNGRGLSAVRVDRHIIQLPHLERKAPSSEATGENQSLSTALFQSLGTLGYQGLKTVEKEQELLGKLGTAGQHLVPICWPISDCN